MYKGRKISVAMATYNGEKYIEEQIRSFFHQTVRPDEIVISDDGSTDRTMEIAESVAKTEEAKGIHFTFLRDNPNHGFGGNFEWAMKHTATADKDIIILSDQDDVVYEHKIEAIAEAFEQEPEALLIFHNAHLVDKNRNVLPLKFDDFSDVFPEGSLSKLPRSKYLKDACLIPLTCGMVISVTRAFFDKCVPFPRGYSHDNWLMCEASVYDGCFYLNKVLGERRLHETNFAGRSDFNHRGLSPKIKRVCKKMTSINDVRPAVLKARAAILEMEKNHLEETEGYSEMQRELETNLKIVDIFKMGRLKGALMLILFRKDSLRYRNSGKGLFLYQLQSLLFFSKKKRIQFLDEEGL